MCAMAVYNFVRVGGNVVPGGYGFDNILEKEVKLNKLKFIADSKFKGRDWHVLMADKYPMEYIIYNQFDSIGMNELENKTKDFAVSLPVLSGFSDFRIFNSGPKRLVVRKHFFYLEEGKVAMTKPTEYTDDTMLGTDDWIVTLPAHLTLDNGLRIIFENVELNTNIRAFVFDIDAVSSYPSDIIAANVSRQTTKREISSIEGIEKSKFMLENINLVCGSNNASLYCSRMMNFPSTPDLFKKIKEKRRYVK